MALPESNSCLLGQSGAACVNEDICLIISKLFERGGPHVSHVSLGVGAAVSVGIVVVAVVVDIVEDVVGGECFSKCFFAAYAFQSVWFSNRFTSTRHNP